MIVCVYESYKVYNFAFPKFPHLHDVLKVLLHSTAEKKI